MIVISNVPCGDNYTTAASITYQYGSSGGYATIRNNSALCQIAWSLRGGEQGNEQWTNEFQVEPGNLALSPGIIGIRFRNATPGSAAVISAVLSAHEEPSVYLTAAGVVPGTTPTYPHIDSTDNVGLPWGVQSISPIRGDEIANLVLTSTGAGGSIWAPQLTNVVTPFATVMANIAATVPLLGWWRLGDGASPFVDSSPLLVPGQTERDMIRQVTGVAMNQDFNPGALPPGQDDGAVEFVSPNNVDGDWLKTASDARFDVGSNAITLAGFLYPVANANTWTGLGFGRWEGIAPSSWPGGYGITVDWPTLTVKFLRALGGSSSSTVGQVSGGTLTASVWSFVVGVYDGAGGHSIYVNGSLVATATQAGATPNSTGSGAMIARPSLFPPSSFPGSLRVGLFYGGADEVSIWRGALTPAQISALWLAASTSTPTINPANDTAVWLPLTTTNASGDDVLVFDADHSLIPTLIPF